MVKRDIHGFNGHLSKIKIKVPDIIVRFDSHGALL